MEPTGDAEAAEEGKDLLHHGSDSDNGVFPAIWKWLNKICGFLAGLALCVVGAMQWFEWRDISTTNFQVCCRVS